MNVISGINLQEKLSVNFSNIVNSTTQYEVETVKPIELLNSRRFDILAKYLYAKYSEKKIECKFAEELYLDHIKAFNNFVEADGSKKVGSKIFLSSVNSLLHSLKNEGFRKSNPIPLSRDGVILDGAHRVGLSLALEQNITTIKLDADSPSFDYNFFRNRGMDEDFLDHLASQYAEIKKNTRMVILWPTAVGQQKDVEKVLQKYGDIVYFKDVHLNKTGAHSLVSLAYRREHWVGSIKDGYSGANSKANWCFSEKGPLRVFLFESNNDLIEMKDEIRNIFKVGKHSIHINDTHQETLELSQYLFNKNSVILLNSMIHRQLNWFNRLFKDYQSWLSSKHHNYSDFCIDGSGTLAAFGARDVRDLDFLFSGDKLPSTGFKEIDCHNLEHLHKGLSPDQIIHDPRNHFFFAGAKFVGIGLLRSLKALRNEEKDKHDIKLIDSLLSGVKFKTPLKYKVKRMLSIQYMKSKIKLVALKIRYNLVKYKNKGRG